MKRRLRSSRVLGIAGIVAICGTVLSSCGGGAGSEGDGGFGSGSAGDAVAIQGTFVGGSQAALNVDQVSKVLFFAIDGTYAAGDVTDGAFSLDVEKGTPGGLIFAGSDNRFLGYLTLGGGIDSLPLNRIGEGVTSIDLGTLSSSGFVVEPGRNPLGSELPLSSAEQAAIARADDFFASLVKNPDADGDGVPDFLGDKLYRLTVLYFVDPGVFGAGMTPTVDASDGINSYKLALDAKDSSLPDTVSFTGPAGSGLSGSVSDQKNTYAGRATYFSPLVSSPVIPPEGDYTVAYGGATFRFEVPDQSAAPTSVVLPVPTVALNDDGTIHQVAWVYRLGSGSDTLDPLAVVDGIEVQINGAGAPCAAYPQADRIYNSGELSATATEHELTCQMLLWGNVTSLSMAYDDVYGNHNVVTWQKN